MENVENSISREFHFFSLLKFATPTVIMMIVTALYTIVDSIFVSRYVGTNGSTTISSFTASSAGRGISNKILQEHKRIVSRIQSEVSSDIEVKAEYSVVINGFAVKAKYGDLEDIRQIKGVKSAFVASTYSAATSIASVNNIKSFAPYFTRGDLIHVNRELD